MGGLSLDFWILVAVVVVVVVHLVLAELACLIVLWLDDLLEIIR